MSPKANTAQNALRKAYQIALIRLAVIFVVIDKKRSGGLRYKAM